MSDELSKEILEELKKMNEKLDYINEPRGLSTPMKIVTIFFGFIVVGPFIALFLPLLLRLFH